MREAKWRKVSEYLSGSSSLILPRICEKKVGILTSFVPSEEKKNTLQCRNVSQSGCNYNLEHAVQCNSSRRFQNENSERRFLHDVQLNYKANHFSSSGFFVWLLSFFFKLQIKKFQRHKTKKKKTQERLVRSSFTYPPRI